MSCKPSVQHSTSKGLLNSAYAEDTAPCTELKPATVQTLGRRTNKRQVVVVLGRPYSR